MLMLSDNVTSVSLYHEALKQFSYQLTQREILCEAERQKGYQQSYYTALGTSFS